MFLLHVYICKTVVHPLIYQRVQRTWRPAFPSRARKLGYPLYAADFDPLNSDFLLVGGGGGSSSTGVPNKISLLDVSRQYESAEITDLELAKDEDSVTTLAVASSSGTSLTAIAGINGSLAEQDGGEK